MNDLVNKIIDKIAYHFENSTFQLHESFYSNYVISGYPLSKAINVNKNDKIPVNTLLWFDDFWVYFEIKFSKRELESFSKKDERESYELKLQESNVKIEDAYYNINVTLSVFQGDDSDDNKTQLFRAEWDNYDDNLYHPQPHWQINPFKYDSKTYEGFEEFLRRKEEETFETSLASGANRNELVKINKFHFAMSGQWAENRNHIHKINNESILLNWLDGMLGHIKEQLKFVKS